MFRLHRLCLSLPVWVLIAFLTWSLLTCLSQFLSACFYSPSSVCCVQTYVSPCVGVLVSFCACGHFDFCGDFRFRDCFSWSDLHMPGVYKFDPFNNSLACYTCRAQEATVLHFVHESKPVQACVKAHIFSTSALQHLQQHTVHLWYGLPGLLASWWCTSSRNLDLFCSVVNCCLCSAKYRWENCFQMIFH